MKEYESDFPELPDEKPELQPQLEQPQTQLEQSQPEQSQPEQPQPQPEQSQPQLEQTQPPLEQPEEPKYQPPVEKVENKTKKQGGRLLLSIVACGMAVIAVVTAVFGYMAVSNLNKNWQIKYDALEDSLEVKIKDLQQEIKDNSYTGNGNSVSGSENSTIEGMSPGQVYALNVRSVVAISNESVTTNVYGQTSRTASSGSGFIISADGYVVTNAHMAKNATKLTVITHDGIEYEATLVGLEETNDLAVLKIDATDLPYVKMGSSNALIVGDKVAAIGNPLGELTNTLTVGYVSAKERSISTGGAVINMIQTDAAVNAGNSGGPLFNMKGEVIGIVSAKFSGTSNSGASIEGVGFAIPIDDVKEKVNNLINYGVVSPSYLGVIVADINPDVAAAYGVPLGVLVREVETQYGAYAGGVRNNDVITMVGGKSVTSVNTLTQALMQHKPGETITVRVWRGGTELDFQVTLSQNPEITD